MEGLYIHNTLCLHFQQAPGINLNRLLSRTPSGPTVIGGNFNAVHLFWQPLANTQHGEGSNILEWMGDNDMNLASRPGVPTHARGNTLDLVWSNYGEMAEVAPELDSKSDHRTLAGDVPTPNARGITAIKLARPIQVKENGLEDFAKVMKDWGKELGQQPLRSAQDEDQLAEVLVKLFGDAIKATGRRDAVKSGRSAPWWTEKCLLARNHYRVHVVE